MSGGGMGVSSTGMGQPSGTYPGQPNPFLSTPVNSTMADNFGGAGGNNDMRNLIGGTSSQQPQPVNNMPPMSVNDTLTGYYHNILQREPDKEGLDYWNLKAGQGMSFGDIQNEFLHSNEYLGSQADQQAYARYINSQNNPRPQAVETPYVPVTTTFNAQPQTQTFNAPTVTQSSDAGAVNYQYRRGGIASLVKR